LWLVRSPVGSVTAQEHQSVEAVRRAAKDAGFSVVEVVAVKHSDPDGRGSISFLKPEDAKRMYSALHRSRAGVFAFSGCRVQLNPADRFSRRGSIPLLNFVDTKGIFVLVSRLEEVARALDDVEKWANAIHCPSHRDAQCLPWHTFNGTDERSVPPKDKSGNFVSSRKHVWDARGPRHTQDILQVAGQTLPVGFHWDVQVGRDATLVNAWEMWRVPGHGYANVHPDAFIRGSSATKVYSALGSKETSDKIGRTRKPRRPRHQRARK
jgi:hypothetical protein